MRTPVLVAALAAVLVLSGCNTIEGIGKDIEVAGKRMQGSGDTPPAPVKEANPEPPKPRNPGATKR